MCHEDPKLKRLKNSINNSDRFFIPMDEHFKTKPKNDENLHPLNKPADLQGTV